MKTPHSSIRLSVAVGLLAGMIFVPNARAILISGPDIIAAPPSVIDDPPGAVNDHQQAFNERQGVLLPVNLNVDAGVVPAGTVIDSHMIFLNTLSGGATDRQTWGFGGAVLGVMSDNNGVLEANTSAFLGALGTTYPAAAFNNRGLESNDGYLVAGNQITVNMTVTEPGDWIRVVTAASVPETPSTALLLFPALTLVFFAGQGVRRDRA